MGVVTSRLEDGGKLAEFSVDRLDAGNVAELPDDVKKRRPKYPVPVIRIGRLTVVVDAKNDGAKSFCTKYGLEV